MKKLHRALALFSAVLLMSLHAMPAHAVESDVEISEPSIDIYAELTEGVPDSGFGYAITDRTERVISLSGVMKVGTSQSQSTALSQTPTSFTWKGDGRYNWQSFSLSLGSDKVWACVGSGATASPPVTVDFYAPDVYSANEGGFVNIDGDIQFWVWPAEFSVNDGSSAPSVDTAYAMYPDRAVLIANGVEWGDKVESSGNGIFALSYSIPTDEPVSDVGVRFYFDQYQHKSYRDDSTTLTRYMKFNVFDSMVVDVEVPAPGYIEEIISKVQQIPGTIYNFFFGDDGDEVAEGFKSDVEGVIESGDEVREEFEALEKPNPSDTIPDKDAIIPQEEFRAYTAVFADVLQSKLVLPLMVMALSMAVMAYVVYGKKG